MRPCPPLRVGISLTAALGVAAFLLGASAGAAHAQTYNFVNYDAGSGPPTTVDGIGNGGVEVGFGTDGAGDDHNFTRGPGGAITLLPTVDAADPNGVAMANGINASGTIVGVANGTAFEYSAGLLSDLPAPNPGNTSGSIAFGINDSGTIVGQYNDISSGITPGFIYSGGAYTIIDPAGSAAVNAQSINDDGLVIGFYQTTDPTENTQLGFLYDTNTAGTFLIAPPPTTAFDLAQGGPFLSQYLGINDSGIAVGYYQTNTGNQYGFLYNTNTDAYTFLDDPAMSPTGTQVTQITGINDAGDISGFYTDADGDQHGFFAYETPEPGALALIGASVLPIASTIVRRRRRTIVPAA
jgi:hypothetical protein